jgi:hypothetical protein
MATTRRKEYKGSRPPPQNRPSTSSISILFVMLLVLVGAFVASGNLTPVDPNGPGGPPTLQPYYNPNDYPQQRIVTPTGGFPGNKKNLQLETFTVDNCGRNTVIYFVIDKSGSMSYANKIGNTKKALQYFVNNMGGLSAIGLETFSKDVVVDVPLNYYRDVKPQVNKVISGLKADGWTRTKDALQVAYDNLKTSIDNEDYPGYAYNLVLMTDGVPEVPPSQPRTCLAQTSDPNDAPALRCFAQEEDPTVPVNLPDKIRQLGVDIYTINLYSPSWASDAYMFPYLQHLLRDQVASSPTSSHYFVSINAANLGDILRNIDNNICYDELNGTVHTPPTPAP